MNVSCLARQDGTGKVLEFARDIFGGKRAAPRRAQRAVMPLRRGAPRRAALFCAWHAAMPLRCGAALCAGRVLSGRRRARGRHRDGCVAWRDLGRRKGPPLLPWGAEKAPPDAPPRPHQRGSGAGDGDGRVQVVGEKGARPAHKGRQGDRAVGAQRRVHGAAADPRAPAPPIAPASPEPGLQRGSGSPSRSPPETSLHGASLFLDTPEGTPPEGHPRRLSNLTIGTKRMKADEAFLSVARGALRAQVGYGIGDATNIFLDHGVKDSIVLANKERWGAQAGEAAERSCMSVRSRTGLGARAGAR